MQLKQDRLPVGQRQTVREFDGVIFIGALLRQAGLVPSSSEAMRMIEQGGVRLDGAVVSDKGLKVPAGTVVVQVGKRKFAKVTLG